MKVWVVTKQTAIPYNGEQTSVIGVCPTEQAAIEFIKARKKPGYEYYTAFEYEEFEVEG